MEIYSCLATTDSTDLANRVQKILDFKNYPKEMSDREETYTSVLCNAFDKFLLSDHCCLHQMPLPTTERPDFFMSSLKDGIPSWPKLLADFKISKDKVRL